MDKSGQWTVGEAFGNIKTCKKNTNRFFLQRCFVLALKTRRWPKAKPCAEVVVAAHVEATVAIDKVVHVPYREVLHTVVTSWRVRVVHPPPLSTY